MNTRILLITSAVLMGVAGLAATFLPHEILAALGTTPDARLPVLIQLMGAAWFAFAMMNWTARGSAIGGIYGRAVAIGNLTHFLVGGLALVKYAANGPGNPALVALAIVYTGLAVAFTIVFFRGPVPPPARATS
jgi:hypothetical protein